MNRLAQSNPSSSEQRDGISTLLTIERLFGFLVSLLAAGAMLWAWRTIYGPLHYLASRGV